MKSMLQSVIKNKCPRCHRGEFWAHRNPYYNLLINKARIFESCSHCGLKYERETGYWYGAMYVGYALSIAAFVTAWVATAVLYPDSWPLYIQVFSIIGFAMLLIPVNFYLSRLVWINFFTKYEPDMADGEGLNEKPQIINR